MGRTWQSWHSRREEYTSSPNLPQENPDKEGALGGRVRSPTFTGSATGEMKHVHLRGLSYEQLWLKQLMPTLRGIIFCIMRASYLPVACADRNPTCADRNPKRPRLRALVDVSKGLVCRTEKHNLNVKAQCRASFSGAGVGLSVSCCRGYYADAAKAKAV
jgi:hypothetical protein